MITGTQSLICAFAKHTKKCLPKICKQNIKSIRNRSEGKEGEEGKGDTVSVHSLKSSVANTEPFLWPKKIHKGKHACCITV
jgi:hypothetical protein